MQVPSDLSSPESLAGFLLASIPVVEELGAQYDSLPELRREIADLVERMDHLRQTIDELPSSSVDGVAELAPDLLASMAGHLWGSHPERREYQTQDFGRWLRIDAKGIPDAELLTRAAAVLTGTSRLSAAGAAEFWNSLLPFPLGAEIDAHQFLTVFAKAAYEALMVIRRYRLAAQRAAA